MRSHLYHPKPSMFRFSSVINGMSDGTDGDYEAMRTGCGWGFTDARNRSFKLGVLYTRSFDRLRSGVLAGRRFSSNFFTDGDPPRFKL